MHHKMPQMSICRMCLGTDLRMITIAGTPLQAVYEKVTEAELLDNMKPVVACYICLAQLKRCRTFMEKSVKADEVLNGILMNSKLTIKSVARIDRNAYKLNHPLSIKVIPSEDQEELDVRKVKKELEFEFAGADVSHVEINFDQQTDYPQLNEPIVNIDEKFGQPVVAQVLDVGFLKEEGKEEPAVSDTDDFRDAVSDDDVPLRPAVKKRKRNSDGEVKPKKVKVEGAKKASAKRTGKQKRGRFKRLAKAENQRKSSTDIKPLKESIQFSKTDSIKSETVFQTRHLESESNNDTIEWKRLKCLQRIGEHYECQFCQKTFSKKRQMLGHLPEHRPYECDVCQKRFLRDSHLRQHARIHTGEKPYECDICQCRFSIMFNLKRHLIKHTGEKPYQCNVCGIRLCKTSDLNRHMRTHTGELPFECDICHRRFNRKGNMKTHLKQHTGEKPYQCNICGARFCQSASLQIHIRKHTGEKPFECTVCNRKFSQKANLTTHLKRHTGEKPYECNICQRRFNQKGNLYTHEKKHAKKSLDCDKMSETKTSGLHSESLGQIKS
ncbi:zinc finger protein 771-like isoform X5 [Plodia interpunctella]|uniref:zinc finger protein 771-like isoform X5 n=1 Tax=Plodia interpunctella TaxID=58824 RepID=UPI002367DBC8|nr:zinc finger protein 771-like isoform X5 [Plodia interpunctella]